MTAIGSCLISETSVPIWWSTFLEPPVAAFRKPLPPGLGPPARCRKCSRGRPTPQTPSAELAATAVPGRRKESTRDRWLLTSARLLPAQRVRWHRALSYFAAAESRPAEACEDSR